MDTSMHKDFAAKVKNIVGIIDQSLQCHDCSGKIGNIDKNKSIKVHVEDVGSNSPEAQKVLKKGVEDLIKQQIPEAKKVVATI